MAQNSRSENTSEAKIEIKYVRGAHSRDADPIDPDEDEDLFWLTRDLGSFGSDVFDELDVEEVLETAYVDLADRPAIVDLEDLDVEEYDVETIAEQVWIVCQGPGNPPFLPYNGSYFRSMCIGDVVVVNGTPVMIERFGTSVLDVEVAEDELPDLPGEITGRVVGQRGGFY